MDVQPGYAFAPPVEPAPPQVPYGPWAHLTKPLGGLGGVTACLLAAQAVLALLSAGSAGWTVVDKAGTSGLTGVEQLAPPARTLVLLLLTSLLTVVTGVVFASWLYRAARNNVLCGLRPRRGPGWAWGAWFVPVVSLWWPKQVVDDVVRSSRPDVPAGMDVRWLPTSGVVTVWWLSWLSSAVLAGIGSTVVARELVVLQLHAAPQELAGRLAALDLAPLLEQQALWTMWGSIALCLAACCAVGFVLRVTGDQGERRRLALERTGARGWS